MPDMTALYTKAYAAAAKLRETNDCTVKAVAVVTGLPYAEAHALLRRYGRRPGHGMTAFGPKGYHAAIESLGFTVTRLEGHALNRCKTIVTLGRALPSRGVFLVLTSSNRHVLAARGGQVHDYTAGRRHRIASVWRVSRKAGAPPMPAVSPTVVPVAFKPAPRRRAVRCSGCDRARVHRYDYYCPRCGRGEN